MSTCIECHSPDAELYRGDDGRHRVRCPACGYTGGPYTSSYSSPSTATTRRENAHEQPSLASFDSRRGTGNTEADQ